MVYDITEPSSVDDLQNYWITEAYNYCDKSIKVLLLGNKSDSERVVKSERITKMADKHGYIVEEVSAKTGDKVYDSIKNFGIGIARAKMEKNGMNWFANSPPLTPTLTNSNSSSSQLPALQESNTPKIVN